ncbi:MAG: lipopolysaccharide biosynthesis protein, partial [Candidatus Scalindua rubra]
KSSAVLMPPSSESGVGILGALSDLPVGDFLSKADDATMSFIAILKSRTVMENVIDKYDLVNFYGVENIEEALESLGDNVSFEVEDEGTIRISANVATPWLHPEKEEEIAKELSADIANYFVKQLDVVNKGLKTQQASFQRIFIGERYKQNIEDLKNAEDRLKTFQEEHKMIALPEQTKAAIEVAATIKGQILSNDVQLGVMTTMLIPGHPEIERIKKETEELQLQLKQMDYGSDVSQSDQDKLFPVFSEVPELGIQLIRLQRDVEIQNTLFAFLTQQYEEAKIQEAKDTPTVQVLDQAKIPYKKYKPSRTRIAIVGFVLSLIGSMYFYYFKMRWYS